jgi:diphosphoinositol-polyphosphate diphosphatase
MVKEKPNSTRIYDKDGFRRRAACICVKNPQESEVSQRVALEFKNF